MRAAADHDALESIGWAPAPSGEEARLERIRRELERGFTALRDVEPAVAFFGSARSPSGAPEYDLARATAQAVAAAGSSRGGRTGLGVGAWSRSMTRGEPQCT